MLQTVSRTRSSTKKLMSFALIAAVFAGAGFGESRSAHAQTVAPRAGSSIGNRASADYSDGSGISRTVTSNEVVTIVQQVAAVTLVDNRNIVAAPGSSVYFPHTVTNNGNGTDTFTLTATNNSGFVPVSGPFIYADLNKDGIPDNNTPITTTPALLPGESFDFVVGETLPNSAAGSSSTTLVTATSVIGPGISAQNTDTVTLTNNAVVNLTKVIDVTSGPSSGTRTYTLTYTNNSSTDATNFTITDTLPAGVTYVGGSGVSSNAPGTPLTDANDGADGYSVVGNTITDVIGTVPAGSSANLKFQVTINAGQTTKDIVNTATDSYNGGGGSSNPATYHINQTGNLTFNGATVPSANPGQPVSFTNVVTNTGNGTDSFDVVVNGAGNFPTGTSFQLFKSDGKTPLVDTNGNQIPDTGPLAPGATYNVVLVATLPPTSFAPGNGSYTVTKTATSFVDPTKSATATDTLTTITPQTVDLTNGAGLGVGPGPEALPVLVVSGNPGTSVVFPLTVNNTGTVADTYALQYSINNPFSPGTLPAGYTVVFRDSNGAVVTNTGVITGGGSASFTATVFIPAGQAAGSRDIFFRATSPTSGLADTIHDQITINAVNSLTIQPNRASQVFPGGSVVYQNTVTNNGNATLTGIAIGKTDSNGTFTSNTYVDTNNNGVLEASEIAAGPVTSINLAAGASQSLLTQVFAPLGATPGTIDVTSLTVTSGALTSTATDTTTVVAGALSLAKLQSTTGVAGSFTNANLTALPGTNIYYQITVRNTGVQAVSNVVINDATPVGTTLVAAPGSSSNPGLGGTGPITFSVGTLNSGQSATVTFSVRIDG